MRHDDPIRTLIRGLAPPVPPEALEVRTLAAAVRELRVHREPDLWERAWASRAVRLVWVTCVLVLLAGHAALSVRFGSDGGARRARADGPARLPAEIAQLADLPPIVLSAAAWESAGGAVPGPAGAPPGPAKEVVR